MRAGTISSRFPGGANQAGSASVPNLCLPKPLDDAVFSPLDTEHMSLAGSRGCASTRGGNPAGERGAPKAAAAVIAPSRVDDTVC